MKGGSIAIFFCALLAAPSRAQVGPLPEGGETLWRVEGPEQLVAWQAFNPSTVESRLPPNLRFVSIGELAAKDVGWAVEFLAENPGTNTWGVSFVEVVRAEVYSIDGRDITWGADGAAGLWMARVVSHSEDDEVSPASKFLTLAFWIPDGDFVEFSLTRGHFAEHGSVRLRGDTDSSFEATISLPGLSVSGTCAVSDTISAQGSGGSQVFFPPAGSKLTGVVRVAFEGHVTRECRQSPEWEISGDHPLASSISIGGIEMQEGYRLIGGAYPDLTISRAPEPGG